MFDEHGAPMNWGMELKQLRTMIMISQCEIIRQAIGLAGLGNMYQRIKHNSTRGWGNGRRSFINPNFPYRLKEPCQLNNIKQFSCIMEV